ncbi:acyl-CoA synthetase [Candidatus Chloroploca sp. M-50]|uniref:Acyl-CoA synthetase n=1 Tax=Candidatus Chloroploca mongolica TaxID=2528176 RepID=A0ABS4DG10_9CHLR|nr:acyl-CoA synthetase [Candidatus Chloroploca mongolica]MBP1468373.1 acyl-CoA synthetase [Candidatus Chloroploca mongolica]
MTQFSSLLAAARAWAETDPERPCVIWEQTTLTYGALLAAARQWALRYAHHGVIRGDRVGLYLAGGPAFLGAYLGAHLAGAAVVLINTQYRRVELAHILGDSEPRVVVCEAEGATHLRELDERPWAEVQTDPTQVKPAPVELATGATPHHSGEGAVDEAGSPSGVEEQPVPAPDEETPLPISEELPRAEDLAILAYTSGTTGRSKGAMLTHGCLVANSEAICTAWNWQASDRLLLVLPLFHIHGLGVGVHGTLLRGASVMLRPRFEPEETLATLREGRCTMFFGVPTIYTRLIDTVGAGEALREAGKCVRLFVSGSAALSPQTFADFARLAGQPILERYGMTETGMNLTNPYTGERHPGSVGGPFPGQEARIVEMQSRQPVPAGTIGEIQVRGPHVFAGYWRNPTATAEVLAEDGWFSTGDLGHCSDDGYYTITGRAKELIISGGYNIYPREVEEVLLDHPGVAECAVFGLPDATFGEQVVAAVVPRDPAHPPTHDELEHFCREQLAAYKRPRQIRLLTALPRNAMGKVQKHVLKQEHAG